MAASSCLHELYLDYNNIGDLAASSVLVGLASHRHLQVLDLEGTCITDRFAEVITVTFCHRSVTSLISLHVNLLLNFILFNIFFLHAIFSTMMQES
jgi:hypothetical protein